MTLAERFAERRDYPADLYDLVFDESGALIGITPKPVPEEGVRGSQRDPKVSGVVWA